MTFLNWSSDSLFYWLSSLGLCLSQRSQWLFPTAHLLVATGMVHPPPALYTPNMLEDKTVSFSLRDTKIYITSSIWCIYCCYPPKFFLISSHIFLYLLPLSKVQPNGLSIPALLQCTLKFNYYNLLSHSCLKLYSSVIFGTLMLFKWLNSSKS